MVCSELWYLKWIVSHCYIVYKNFLCYYYIYTITQIHNMLVPTACLSGPFLQVLFKPDSPLMPNIRFHSTAHLATIVGY